MYVYILQNTVKRESYAFWRKTKEWLVFTFLVITFLYLQYLNSQVLNWHLLANIVKVPSSHFFICQKEIHQNWIDVLLWTVAISWSWVFAIDYQIYLGIRYSMCVIVGFLLSGSCMAKKYFVFKFFFFIKIVHFLECFFFQKERVFFIKTVHRVLLSNFEFLVFTYCLPSIWIKIKLNIFSNRVCILYSTNLFYIWLFLLSVVRFLRHPLGYTLKFNWIQNLEVCFNVNNNL